MSKKLTTYQRDIIRKRALEHRFKAEHDAVTALEAAINDKLAERALADVDKKLLASIPVGWLQPVSYFYARIGSVHHRATVEPARYWPNCCTGTLVVDARDPLADEFTTFSRRKQDLAEQQRQASNQINALLSSVTTLPRLKAVWPEVEPFLYGLDCSVANLPAVNVSQLNSLLDLPVAQEE